MASVILRPSSDIQLGHQCSAGSSGYTLINEETCDNDSTYIYRAITSTSEAQTFSKFGFDTSSIPADAKINSITWTCTSRDSDDKISSGSYAVLSNNGTMIPHKQISGPVSGLTTTYETKVYKSTEAISSLGELILQLSSGGSKASSKDDDGYVRITQAYIEIDYTEASNTYNCAAVAKDNITAAAVSSSKIVKGDSVIFTATYENYCPFLGWYGDEACTNLVSTDNPLTITPTEDLTLYAKAGENIGRTITLTMPNTLTFFIGKGVYLGGFKQDLLTSTDYANLKAGRFSYISSEKVWEQNSATGATNKEHKTSVFVPKGCLLAMYGDPSTSSDNNSELYIYETSGTPLSYIPYYQVVCDGNHDYIVGTEYRCECTASAGDGIESASVDYPELIQGGYATFTATVQNGYSWDGWYSDSSYTTLVSKNQTYTVQAPYKTSSVSKVTSIVLYAKATPTDQNYNLYLKQNGSWANANVRQLYIKENGKWVFKVSADGVFDTNTKYVKGDL